jgi:hypothetical protein
MLDIGIQAFAKAWFEKRSLILKVISFEKQSCWLASYEICKAAKYEGSLILCYKSSSKKRILKRQDGMPTLGERLIINFKNRFIIQNLFFLILNLNFFDNFRMDSSHWYLMHLNLL